MALGSKATGLVISVIIFLVLSWLTVGLRCIVRGHILHVFGRDDWAMLIAQIVYSTFLVCHFVAIAYGEGRHSADLAPQDVILTRKWMLVLEFLYCQNNALIKVSLGLFLLRIATKPRIIVVIRLLTALSFLMSEFIGFLVLFQCWPIPKFWDPHAYTHGHCIKPQIYADILYGFSATNIISDALYASLPYFIIKDMQISRRQKWICAALMGLGGLGSGATVGRVIFLEWITDSSLDDFLYTTVNCTISTVIENGVGIIAGSLATLRPLVRKFVSSPLMSDSEPDPGLCPAQQLPQHNSPPQMGKSPAFLGKRTMDRWDEFGCSPRDLDQWGGGYGPATCITAASCVASGQEPDVARKEKVAKPKLWRRKTEVAEEDVECPAAVVPRLVVNVQEEFEVR